MALFTDFHEDLKLHGEATAQIGDTGRARPGRRPAGKTVS